MWVNSKYASELAVLSAWLSAFLPWNLTHSSFGDLGGTLFVRFPFFQVQYTWFPVVEIEGEVRTFRQTGFEVVRGVWVADPLTARLSATGVGANAGVVDASATWLVGAGLVGVAFLLSFGLYFFEERFEAAPVDPVRAMGGLLALGAVALSVATVQLWNALPGIPIPVGIAVMATLAWTLLRVERKDFDRDRDTEPPAESDI
jgi:hypothetical protein